VPWRVPIPGHAFAPVIIFIPWSEPGCKGQSEWLPRQCPACHQDAVIGHGRRRRQAHDEIQSSILIRRAICKLCDGTITVLPQGCVPGAIYNLATRQQALEQLGQDVPAEQAVPHCQDPDRIADASTIRRWCWRCIESLPLVRWAPTLLAWDWRAARRILIAELVSP